MITIDYLRKNAERDPWYFGLGTVKVQAPEGAYRFYCHDVAEQFIDRIHNHTYGFRSEVVKGTLTNIMYDLEVVDYETDLKLIGLESLASQEQEGKTLHENVVAHETIRFDTPAGFAYEIQPRAMHRIEHATKKIITRLTPITENTEIAKYVIDKTIPYINPWSRPKSPAKCWEIVEYILADD